MASAAMAGLAMRLVQRRELRLDPMAASTLAASVAAAGPCSSSSRKMKVSPAVTEWIERGLRTGNRPASTMITRPTATCQAAWAGRSARLARASTRAVPPASTTVHQ